MQIPRFTSSKPSEFAFASDEKSIRRPTASFVRCHLKNRRAGNPARRSRLSKTHGELERAEALSIINRARRRVRRVREDFCGGKSHFPEQKSLPCRFCARGFRRNPSKICEAENPKGFQVSPKAKLPTAKSMILTRHRGGGSGGGACSPVHQLVKKTFLTS